MGIEVPIAAVAQGAKVIEKHFTLDRGLAGPDHSASLEPSELKALVKSIRNIEHAIAGTGGKEPSRSETKNKDIARKNIHVNRDLHQGEVLDETDLDFTRFLESKYGHEGIRVNVVPPSGVFDHQPEQIVKAYEKKVPMKRMGNPDHIAQSVSFLLSEEAKYITGQNLIVDVGWSAI
ncbi:MAG: hypothetical protein ACI9YE_000586 [Psychroserpens sp.]